MNKEEPKVLTRMKLSCCWGDNLNVTELNEVVDYINTLQQENKQLKDKYLNAVSDYEYEKAKENKAIEEIDEMIQDYINSGFDATVENLSIIKSILKGE